MLAVPPVEAAGGEDSPEVWADRMLTKISDIFEFTFVEGDNLSSFAGLIDQVDQSEPVTNSDQLTTVLTSSLPKIFIRSHELSEDIGGDVEVSEIAQALCLGAATHIAMRFDNHTGAPGENPLSLENFQAEVEEEIDNIASVENVLGMIALIYQPDGRNTDHNEDPKPNEGRLLTRARAERPKTRRRSRRRGSERNDVGESEALLKQYLSEIGQTPMLTADEEVELAQTIEAAASSRQLRNSPDWDELPAGQKQEHLRLIEAADAAEKRFTQANLRLVVSIAKKYKSSHRSILDRIQDGNLGLMHAVEKFDWRKGFKFSTYATWWIKQAIQRELGDKSSTIRLTSSEAQRVAQLKKYMSMLENKERGDRPIIEELAGLMNLSEQEVKKIMRSLRLTESMSINYPTGPEDKYEIQDIIPDHSIPPIDEGVFADEMHQRVEQMLDGLPPAEKMVLRLRYGIGSDGETMTLEEVGKIMGTGRERIRQIESKAFSIIRHPSTRLRELKELIN